MKISQAFSSSLRALRGNRSRTALTMLGIIIGIASVIIILSVGASAQNLILDQIRSVGSDLVVIFPGESDESGPPVGVLGIAVTTLKNSDISAIEDPSRVPNVTAGSGYIRGIDIVIYQNRSVDTSYMGVSASYLLVEEANIEEGRFFSDQENDSLRRVVVLGSDLKEELFGVQDPIGQSVRIKNERFTVIGTLIRRGVSGFQNTDRYAFVPIKTGQRILLGVDHLTFARIKVDDPERMEETIAAIRETLREEHNLRPGDADDFTIRTTAQALGILTTVTDAITFFLGAVAAVSLLVGGVGIMNIMLVAITERTQEIGLRKAIGAKKYDIIMQFVIESMLIAFIGGVVGIIFGVLVSWLIGFGINQFGFEWDFIVTPGSIILAVTFSVVVGLLFGIYPAYRASELHPIEALRYE